MIKLTIYHLECKNKNTGTIKITYMILIGKHQHVFTEYSHRSYSTIVMRKFYVSIERVSADVECYEISSITAEVAPFVCDNGAFMNYIPILIKENTKAIDNAINKMSDSPHIELSVISKDTNVLEYIHEQREFVNDLYLRKIYKYGGKLYLREVSKCGDALFYQSVNFIPAKMITSDYYHPILEGYKEVDLQPIHHKTLLRFMSEDIKNNTMLEFIYQDAIHRKDMRKTKMNVFFRFK